MNELRKQTKQGNINKQGVKEIGKKRKHKKWRYEELKKKIKRRKPTWKG